MDYSEHEKLQKVKDQSQHQGELLEWLCDNGYTICQWNYRYEEFSPANKTSNQLLAELHEIDLNKIEKEKREMLKELNK